MWNITVDKTWTTDQKKRMQQMLNRYGFTDDNGKSLTVDGVFGPKSMQAIEKMKTYQQHLANPDPETRALQVNLRTAGFKNPDGTPLKVDGIYGPKTDVANNMFENSFLDGLTEGKNQNKTVQTKTFPKIPKTTDEEILNAVGYKNGGAQHKLISNLPNNGAPVSAKPMADPMAGQKNPDGTWKQVAKPGAWAGSGQTSLETIASMSKLYQPYAQANKDAEDLQERANEYRRQADVCTQKAVEAAQKVRMGLARPEDEYNGLQQQRKYLQEQADTTQKKADSLRKDSDNLKKQMEKLAAEQTRGMLEASGLFNSSEEAAADFAKRAMPLTDKTGHEYSAVMTTVQVPEYKDGKMQMKTKYKYGTIVSGKAANVIDNALVGLFAPSGGKKYLLHTHPNNTGYVQDYFSGLPNDLLNMGDASIPTLAGSKSYQLPKILNTTFTNIAGMGNPVTSAILRILQDATGRRILRGYDGIYLASPNGNLYLYQGEDNESGKLWENHPTKPIKPIKGMTIPRTKGNWDDQTGEYMYKK
jgi:peptidoglycan hydrolase-like protein with peptidoglycan-binding domain